MKEKKEIINEFQISEKDTGSVLFKLQFLQKELII